MKQVKIYLLIIICFLVFFTFYSPPVHAATAAEDYQAYVKTRYASSEWNNFVKEGMESFHASNYDIAHNTLYKAFNKGCESPVVIFMLALLSEYKQSYYSALDYYKMAAKGFKKANKDHRYNKTFDENYGRALYYSGKTQEALPVLRKAAKTSKSYWLLKLLGMLAYEQGDTLNALSYLERAVRVRSTDVTKEELIYVYTLLGKLFLHKGEQDGAHRYYQKVIELDPNNPDAKKFMGIIEKTYRNKQMMELMDNMSDM
ncbi:MAG: tetratricopeptide repeat protein [bacterium]|nr:tetratricopeptide repeat protein [bacterium]MBU1917416.1 tetratricopeptide repeat protein [bacterium]